MEKYNKLRVYNLVMGFLHLAQGVVVVLLSNDFSTQVTTSYLKFNAVQRILETVQRDLFEIRFGYWVAAFLFLSALAHLIIATIYYPRYCENLDKGINKARWIEYSISASLMIVLIGSLSGISDLSTLLAMFGLTAIMNLLGLVMELVNQGKEKPDWLSYWIGCLSGIIPWIIIMIYFWGASSEADNAIPTFVYWIYISIFIFFNTFAVNMYLQYSKIGKWRDYTFGEYVYVFLSLTAKSLLAWQIFAGTLRPQ